MCLLTKTLRCEGLPASLSTAVERGPLTEEQARAAEEALLHAHLWDCTQVKLPKKLDISKPHWVFPREYGVPVRRKVYVPLHTLHCLGCIHSFCSRYGGWSASPAGAFTLASKCCPSISARQCYKGVELLPAAVLAVTQQLKRWQQTPVLL